MGIASTTCNFLENESGSVPSINIDTLITDKIRICYTGDHLSEESNRFLTKFLRVSDVTECHRVKWIVLIFR